VSDAQSVSINDEVGTVEEVTPDPTQMSWKEMIEYCRGKSGFWHFGYSGC